jgi:hypothetical protein
MPKYYVKSGQIKYIIDCANHEMAIVSALKHYKGRGIMTGPRICISEQGFEDFKQWKCYDTDEYMKRA